MSSLIVDTAKLSESGQDILTLTNELREEFDALFTRISNMSTKTLEWVGTSSEDFIRRTNIEKIQYIKLIEILKKYGSILINAASSYESVIKQ